MALLTIGGNGPTGPSVGEVGPTREGLRRKVREITVQENRRGCLGRKAQGQFAAALV
jgi:hypothetical protein